MDSPVTFRFTANFSHRIRFNLQRLSSCTTTTTSARRQRVAPASVSLLRAIEVVAHAFRDLVGDDGAKSIHFFPKRLGLRQPRRRVESTVAAAVSTGGGGGGTGVGPSQTEKNRHVGIFPFRLVVAYLNETLVEEIRSNELLKAGMNDSRKEGRKEGREGGKRRLEGMDGREGGREERKEGRREENKER